MFKKNKKNSNNEELKVEEIKVEEIKVADLKEKEEKQDLVKVEKKKKEKKKLKITKDGFLSFITKIALLIALCVLLFLFIAAISHTAHFWNAAVNMYHEGLHYEKDT